MTLISCLSMSQINNHNFVNCLGVSRLIKDYEKTTKTPTSSRVIMFVVVKASYLNNILCFQSCEPLGSVCRHIEDVNDDALC